MGPYRFPRGTSSALRISLGVGIVGSALCILGFVVDARTAYGAYLTAYVAVLGTVLGALILVMMSYATGARWFVVLRRLTETAAATVPVLLLLFVPILLGLHDLYPWVPPLDRVDAPMRALVQQKHAYLNVPFFLVRGAVYFGVWLAIALLLRRWSVRQDDEHGVRLTRWQRRLSAGGLPAVAVTLTFASFDWMMSLTPAWYSTIYGVYVFAGGFVAALALIAVLAAIEHETGRLADPVIGHHFQALGKLLLTFVMFWAYIAFAQILIIWIGGIPAEVSWYAVRVGTTLGRTRPRVAHRPVRGAVPAVALPRSQAAATCHGRSGMLAPRHALRRRVLARRSGAQAARAVAQLVGPAGGGGCWGSHDGLRCLAPACQCHCAGRRSVFHRLTRVSQCDLTNAVSGSHRPSDKGSVDVTPSGCCWWQSRLPWQCRPASTTRGRKP